MTREEYEEKRKELCAKWEALDLSYASAWFMVDEEIKVLDKEWQDKEKSKGETK